MGVYHVIAKILPGFTNDKKMQAYKGVLKESLQEGHVNSSGSLEVLKQMCLELNISDRDREQILIELGVENPSLFDPNKQRTREDIARLKGFRNRIKELVKGLGEEHFQVVKKEKQAIGSLSLEYDVTPAEKAEIMAEFE